MGLAGLLVVAFVYIALDKHNDAKDEREYAIYLEGANYGYESAVYSLAELAVTCDVVPITVDNQTIELIAVECLQQT